MTPDRPLRIGLVTPGFSASEADWCIPAQLDLVRALAERDDVRVFALRYPHERRTYGVHGAQVHAFAAAQRRGPRRLFMWARVRLALRREHRRRPFDVLHALWAHEPGFLATLAGRVLRVPVVVSVLGGELADLPEVDYGGGRTWLNRRLVGAALRGATRVTVGSTFLKRIAEGAGRWDERWTVWPLGVDTARFHPSPREGARARARAAGAPVLDGHPALLSVGSLAPIKDHATLLRAFALARRELPRSRLHVVGDGPLRASLDALALELSVADAVRFHGHVAHERLPDVYHQADLFVVSSRFESQCLAALEAAACGCVVMGTAVGALPELSADAAVAPRDVPALAQALSRAAGATTCLFGPGGATRRGDRWTLDAAVAVLRQIYAGVL